MTGLVGSLSSPLSSIPMGVLSDKLALLIEQMKQSDERLESLTSDYIAKTTKQLQEMEDMLKEE